jgi:hypothetical protein
VSNDDLRNQTAPKCLECFEAVGVEPVFLNQDQAIDYAIGRAGFRSGEIRVFYGIGTI